MKVITWNVAYGGLGREQNFKADGGTDYRPRSRAAVEENLAGIVSVLRSFDADVMLFQELARPSYVNHRVDVLGGVRETLAAYRMHYVPDVKTRLIPPPFSLDVGLGVFLKASDAGPLQTHPLPKEKGRILFRKRYQIAYVTVPSGLSETPVLVGNVHLAAFDDGASVRRAQLQEIVNFAEAHYRAGHSVIIGGDWNLRLAATAFPHTTDEQYLFWLADLPGDLIPPGWQMVADDTTPSVRTVHKRYDAGDNYTAVIDGFLVSPDLHVAAVHTHDLAFAYSDHQPVTLEVTRRCEPPRDGHESRR